MIDWTNRVDGKQVSRQHVMTGREWKHALLLPAATALDLKTGIEAGTITKRTALTLCERDPQLFSILRFNAEKMLDGYRKPNLVCDRFSNLKLKTKVDLAWLDLLGNLTPADCRWVREELTGKLLPNARVAFTMAVFYRHNPVIGQAVEVVKANRRSLLIRKMWSEYVRHRVMVPNPYTLVAQTCLLSNLFKGYTFNLSYLPYRSSEKHVHVTYILSNIRAGKSVLPVRIGRNIEQCQTVAA